MTAYKIEYNVIMNDVYCTGCRSHTEMWEMPFTGGWTCEFTFESDTETMLCSVPGSWSS